MKKKICVIIPCYRVKDKIISVLNNKKLSNIDKIVIVDDQCPDNTGLYLKNKLKRKRKYKILFHKKNQGVGGATISGLKYALKNNFDLAIKIDGDGQHNLSILEDFKKKIFFDNIDFCKGYRQLSFFNFQKNNMPFLRILGARALTFLTRINSGNWTIKDPCHGLIAIDCKFLKKINLKKLKKNYFFEQDLIITVIKLKGRIKQFKNEVFYGNETSSLNPLMSILPFLYYHIQIFLINLRS